MAMLLKQSGGRLMAQLPFDGNTLFLVIAIAALIAFIVFLAIFARFARLWVQSVTTGAGIGIFDLMRMWFRKVNPTVITRCKIMVVQSGLDDEEEISTKALEAHYLAGGNVPLVIRAMIAARKAKIIELSFKRATAIDLAGRNILEAVQTSVYPRVIDCPSRESKRPSLDADREGRHPTESEGPRHGAGKPRPVDRRCD